MAVECGGGPTLCRLISFEADAMHNGELRAGGTRRANTGV